MCVCRLQKKEQLNFIPIHRVRDTEYEGTGVIKTYADAVTISITTLDHRHDPPELISNDNGPWSIFPYPNAITRSRLQKDKTDFEAIRYPWLKSDNYAHDPCSLFLSHELNLSPKRGHSKVVHPWDCLKIQNMRIQSQKILIDHGPSWQNWHIHFLL